MLPLGCVVASLSASKDIRYMIVLLFFVGLIKKHNCLNLKIGLVSLLVVLLCNDVVELPHFFPIIILHRHLKKVCD